LSSKVVSEYRFEALQEISEGEAANSAQRKRPDLGLRDRASVLV
jgi:hypothetical protein